MDRQDVFLLAGGWRDRPFQENLTDFDYVGSEQIGNEYITLVNNGSFEGFSTRTTRPLHAFSRVEGPRHFATLTKPNVLVLLGWRNNSIGSTTR